MDKNELHRKVTGAIREEEAEAHRQSVARAAEKQLAQERIANLEKRFPEVAVLASRNRSVQLEAAQLVEAVRGDSLKEGNVCIFLNEIAPQPGKHVAVQINQTYEFEPARFKTRLVTLGDKQGQARVEEGRFTREGQGKTFSDESTFATSLKGFNHAANDPFYPDEIYSRMLEAIDEDDSFQASGGIFHPVVALRKTFCRLAGETPQPPEAVLADIKARLEGLESTWEMAAHAAADPSLNPFIAEVLERTTSPEPAA